MHLPHDKRRESRWNINFLLTFYPILNVPRGCYGANVWNTNIYKYNSNKKNMVHLHCVFQQRPKWKNIVIPVQFLFIQSLIVGFPVCSHQVCSNWCVCFFSFIFIVKMNATQFIRSFVRFKSRTNYFNTFGFHWTRKLWFSIGCLFRFFRVYGFWPTSVRNVYCFFLPSSAKQNESEKKKWKRKHRKKQVWLHCVLCVYVLCWLTNWVYIKKILQHFDINLGGVFVCN